MKNKVYGYFLLKKIIVFILLPLSFIVIANDCIAKSEENSNEIGRIVRKRTYGENEERYFLFKVNKNSNAKILSIQLLIDKNQRDIVKAELDYNADNFSTFSLSPRYLSGAKIILTYKNNEMSSKPISIEKSGFELLAPEEYVLFIAQKKH